MSIAISMCFALTATSYAVSPSLLTASFLTLIGGLSSTLTAASFPRLAAYMSGVSPVSGSAALVSAPSLLTSLRAASGCEESMLLRMSCALCTGCCVICPNPTNRTLTTSHSSRGSHDSSCTRVCSGCLLETHPRTLKMRCMCVSTPIPSTTLYATLRMMYAIFGPMPGSAVSSLAVLGTFPPCSSMRICAACLIYLVLLLWNPTLKM
mmetsp:Transcript_35575/g.83318  ORF Transcript_35575/g.83318 Transcript_35575/m.83318 type:complete len:208 (-) Transcript_35575:416-1039(-)